MPELVPEPTLVLGCGYLGRFLCACPERPSLVVVTRHAARLQELRDAGVDPIVGDVTAPRERERLLPALYGRVRHAAILLPPSAYGADAAASAALLGSWLAALGVVRALLVSSSAVYGDRAGGEVDATSAIDAREPRAARLFGIERAWQVSAPGARVLRLAGLYGPGRVVGAAAMRAGEPVPGSGEEWLNLVRVEDAARALLACLARADAPTLGLLSDGSPITRREYYTSLAAILGTAPPRFAVGVARDGGSRRCNPAATWRALGLMPRHPDPRDGLADLG